MGLSTALTEYEQKEDGNSDGGDDGNFIPLPSWTHFITFYLSLYLTRLAGETGSWQ